MVKFIIGDRIIVEPHKENIKESEGGLLLAEKHREDVRGRKATVIKVGLKVPENILKEGDEIYYDRFAGFTLDLDGKLTTVVRLDDVIVVL